MLDFQWIRHQTGCTRGQKEGICHKVACIVSLGIGLVPFTHMVPDGLPVFNTNLFFRGHIL